MAYLTARGYYCIRSYASAGLFDIIAVPPKNYGPTLMVQAKYNGYVKPIELQRLKSNDKWAGAQVIAYTIKHKLKFRNLGGVSVEFN